MASAGDKLRQSDLLHRKHAYIRASALIGLKDLVGLDDASFEDHLKTCGIDPVAARSFEGLIAYAGYASLLEQLAGTMERPTLGLDLARASAPGFASLGPLALVSRFGPTLRKCASKAFRYWRYHTSAYRMILGIDRRFDLAFFRFSESHGIEPGRQAVEHMLSCSVMLTVEITNKRDSSPALLHFRHQPLAPASVYEEHFSCPVLFGQEFDQILFDPDLLETPTEVNPTILKAQVEDYLQPRMEQVKRHERSLTVLVRMAIASILGSGSCSAETVAQALGLHPKKMQRLLREEDTSFAQLLEQERQQMACLMLANPDIPIARIAGLLDYAEQAPFTTAFRRWQGTTPSAYRKQATLMSPADGDQ